MAQGSTRAFVVKGRPIVTQGGSGQHKRDLGAWRQSVAAAARAVSDGLPLPVRTTPITLSALFYIPRPASLPKRIARPAKKPDLDRLLRAVLDALTGICWWDDSQVVRLGAVEKCFATAMEPPGVHITVEAL